MKILFDHSILTKSEKYKITNNQISVNWGDKKQLLDISVAVPLDLRNDEDEIDCLPEIVTLSAQGEITGYTYLELQSECYNDNIKLEHGNVLKGMKLIEAPSVIDRSKFQRRDCQEFFKKDNQIKFIKYLLSLTEGDIQSILNIPELRLSEFEIQNLKNITEFQYICGFGKSDLYKVKEEHYPDLLHIWTAEKNNMDVFLTHDTKIKRICENHILKQKNISIKWNVEIMHPSELLKLFKS